MTRRRFSTPDIPPCGCQISPSNTTGRTGIWLHARMRSCRSLHALAGPDICSLVKQIATIHFSKGLSTGRSLRRERHIICSSSSPWRNSMKLNHRDSSRAFRRGSYAPRTAHCGISSPYAGRRMPVPSRYRRSHQHKIFSSPRNPLHPNHFRLRPLCRLPNSAHPWSYHGSVGAPPLARAGKVRPDRLVRFLAVPPHLTCLSINKTYRLRPDMSVRSRSPGVSMNDPESPPNPRSPRPPPPHKEPLFFLLP